MFPFHAETWFFGGLCAIGGLYFLTLAFFLTSKLRREAKERKLNRKFGLIGEPHVQFSFEELLPLTEKMLYDPQHPLWEPFQKRLVELQWPDRLLEIVSRGGKWKRVQALILLGYLKHPPALPKFKDALLSFDRDWVDAAIRGLSVWDSPQTQEILIGLLGKRAPAANSRIATAIESGKADGSPFLISKLEQGDETGKYWAAKLLGKFPNPNAIPLLRKMTSDPSRYLRSVALESLSILSSGDCEKEVVLLMKDPEWIVRVHAQQAAGRIQQKSLIPELVKSLKDPVWWVREGAREALETFGSDSVEPLLAVLNGGDRFARNLAAQVLENIGYLESLRQDAASGKLTQDRWGVILKQIEMAEGVRGRFELKRGQI